MGKLDLNRHEIGEYDLELLLQDSIDIESLDISETPVTNLTLIKEISLKNLKEIDISLTRINDLTPLFALAENLQILHVSQVDISKDMLNSIGELSNLKSLYISYSKISDITPLQNLKHLQILDLSGNESLNDISPLARLEELKILYLQGTGIYSRQQLSVIKFKKFERLSVNESLSSEADLFLNVNCTPSFRQFLG